LQWYGKPHAAVELQLEAVYGLPEVREHTVLFSFFAQYSSSIMDSTDSWHLVFKPNIKEDGHQVEQNRE
jgi:hypothetical protein